MPTTISSVTGRRPLSGLLTALAVATIGMTLQAANFTPGNVVVYRVGDGVILINKSTTTSAPVFLDEYDIAGTLIQSVAMRTTTSGAQQSLLAGFNASTEGLISLSQDERYIIVPGYNGNVGDAKPSTAAVARVIGRVAMDGTMDTSTMFTNLLAGTNIRSAASFDGQSFYSVGGKDGVVYTALGDTSGIEVDTGTQTNNRAVKVVEGKVFVSNASTAPAVPKIMFLPGIPKTAAALAFNTSMTGLPMGATGANTNGFAFIKVGTTTLKFNTLYISNLTKVEKYYTTNGDDWTAAGSVTVNGTSPSILGIGANKNGVGGTVRLFFTVSAAAGNDTSLQYIDDTSVQGGTLTGTPTTIITKTIPTSPTTAAGVAFRGAVAIPVGVTAVDLVTFSANPAVKGGVNLTWQTSTESDNVGFNVWRANTVNGTYTKINKTLIAAKGDAFTGASYGFVDTTAAKGTTYYYKIENMERAGTSVFYSPIPGKAAGATPAPAPAPSKPSPVKSKDSSARTSSN